MSTSSENNKRFIMKIEQSDTSKIKSLTVVVCKENIISNVSVENSKNKCIFVITVLRVRMSDNKEKMLLCLYGKSIDEPDKKIIENKLCEIIVSFSDIEQDLTQLRDYGTGFILKDITNIAHNIIENYRDIPVVSSRNINAPILCNMDIDIIVDDIFEKIKQAVKEHEKDINNADIKKSDNLYPFKNDKHKYYEVPVTFISEIIDEVISSGNLKYTVKEVIKRLKEKGYITATAYEMAFTAHRTIENGSKKEYKSYKAYRITNISKNNEPKEPKELIEPK